MRAAARPLRQGVTSIGPAWFNADWHYRRPATIAGTATTLTNYQVLITLDSSNFVFSAAQSNGSDLRVTASDGTTLLPFWIESWNQAGQSAYVWVKVPSIPASTNVVVYLYYGNSAASSTSDGDATFDFYDHSWCQFLGSDCRGNPVHYATQSWWELYVTYPNVFEDTSFAGRPRYHMLYDGHGMIGHAKGYATSPDLRSWTEYDGGANPPNPNPIMGPGYTENAAFAWGDPIKVGSTYYIYVSRGPGQIERAQSTDLINWSGFTQVTDTDPNGNIGSGAAILKEGDGITPITINGNYWMVYAHDFDASNTIFMAYSTNLIDWLYVGIAFPAATPETEDFDCNGLWSPSFVRFGDQYYIYYQGRDANDQWAIGYGRANATSGGNPIAPDPASTSWSKSNIDADDYSDAVLDRGSAGTWDSRMVIDPEVRRFSDGVYYLFYTGNNLSDDDGKNGYATASSPDGPWTKLPNQVLNWTTTGPASVSSSILSFPSGGTAWTNTLYTQRAIGYRANFGTSGGASVSMWGGFIDGIYSHRTLIGTINADTTGNLYLRNQTTGGTEDTSLLGNYMGSYHVYELLWGSAQTTARVDHGAASATLTSQVPATPLPLSFYNFSNAANPLQVDWVFVRQYSSPEPTTTVRGYSDYQQTLTIAPGTNTFDIVHATIDVASLGSLSSVQIIFYQHSYPGVDPALQTGRYWDILPNTANTDYSLSLTVFHNRVPDDQDRLCYSQDNGANWTCAMSSFNPTTGAITVSGLNHLSEWAVEDNSPTAIRLQGLWASSQKYGLGLAAFMMGLISVIGLAGIFHRFQVKGKSQTG
jgi:hypothetical protein